MELENVITWMDWTTIVFSFITMIFVVVNFFRNKKQQDIISLCFVLEDKEFCIHTYIMRKHLTRAEVSGLLGFFQKNSKDRHNIKYLSSEQYLKDIYDIQSGKKSKLLINVTEEELEQFEL